MKKFEVFDLVISVRQNEIKHCKKKSLKIRFSFTTAQLIDESSVDTMYPTPSSYSKKNNLVAFRLKSLVIPM